jgi:hypothetical protein
MKASLSPRRVFPEISCKAARRWGRWLPPLLFAAVLPMARAADTDGAALPFRLAGQALRLGQEREAVARLAQSIRLQPENNPATAALLFWLTFRDQPLPLYVSEWESSWLPGDWKAYWPEFSLDGRFLYWGGGVFEVSGDTLVRRNKNAGPDVPSWNEPESIPARVASAAERGVFLGKALPDFATDTRETALASADQSLAMLLPEAWLGDGTFPRYSRYSVRFPNTLACAFPPDRPDRLATLEWSPQAPSYQGGRLRYWDIRPSAPRAAATAEAPHHGLYLPEHLRYSAGIGQVFQAPSGARRCLLGHHPDGLSLAAPDDNWRILWTAPRISDSRNRHGYRQFVANDSLLLWWEASRFRSDEASAHDRLLVDVETGEIIERIPADEHSFRPYAHGPWLMLFRGGLGGVLYDLRKRSAVLRSGVDAAGRPEWSPVMPVGEESRHWLLQRPGGTSLLDLETLEITDVAPLSEDGSHAPDGFAALHESAGLLALGNRWGDTRLYDLAEKRMLFEFPRQHGYYKDVFCHAWFHPDGSRLYLSIGNTESEENAELHVWDTRAGRFVWSNPEANLRHPRTDGAGDKHVLFSPGGFWMVGENALGAPVLFDAATGGAHFHVAGTNGAGFQDGMAEAFLRMGETRAPGWLAELAEWTSGVRITPDDLPEETGHAYDPGWLKARCERLAAAPRDDFHGWGRWFLGDRDRRDSWRPAAAETP